ncbi:MAG: protein kinase [Acidobacteria bacterium]|nr:protein kinase [Acidobacteriota bacterium]
MIGQTSSRYRVTGKLGEGAMGEVYRALDARLGREVALKVLPEAFASDGDRLARFAREAQVLASLNHPNIAAVYDLEEHEGKRVLVMELVEGETLADRLGRGPLPLAEALRLALQIAKALHAAHRKGIIHRDLKPANIKVTPEGDVKVLDFGLAKQDRGGGGDSDTEAATLRQEVMTLRGEIVGTPAYMSPEQALGERADARCDVFSFGAVLYEMLTGRRAFSGPTLTAVFQAVLNGKPRPPRRLRPEIPAELDALVMKSLRKERDLRPPDMQAVCAELDRLSAKMAARPPGASATARVGDAALRAREWAGERGKKVWAASALAALAALVALGVLAYRRGDPPPAAALAAPPAPAVSVDKSAGPYELFQQGMEYMKRHDKEERLGAAVESFRTALSRNQDYAPAYAGLGLAYVLKYGSNRDKSLLEQAVQNAKRAVELDGHVALNRVSLGRAYVEKGEYDAAEAELKQALTLEPLSADAHRALADLHKARRNPAEAEKLYRKAIELRPDDWEMHYALGTFYFHSSRFADAERALAESIRLAPDCHMSRRNLGAVYHMQGRFPEAAAEFQKSLQIKPGASTYTNLGTALFFQGLYQQSVAAMEKAVELGANNHQLWANLGDAYRYTKGNEQKAREAYTRAVQLARKELEGKPGDPDLLSRVALSLTKSGDKQQGLAEAGAVEKAEKSAAVLARLVLVYELAGDRERALQRMEEALKKGHSMAEFGRDPDLLELRKDARYHKLAVRFPDAPHG